MAYLPAAISRVAAPMARIVVELIRGRKSLTNLAAQYEVHPNQIKNLKSVFLQKAPELFEDKRKKRSRSSLL